MSTIYVVEGYTSGQPVRSNYVGDFYISNDYDECCERCTILERIYQNMYFLPSVLYDGSCKNAPAD